MPTVKVKGMSCNHCVVAVTKALDSVAGVKNVKVDLGKGEASFEEMAPVDMAKIRKMIEKAGYEVG